MANTNGGSILDARPVDCANAGISVITIYICAVLVGTLTSSADMHVSRLYPVAYPILTTSASSTAAAIVFAMALKL